MAARTPMDRLSAALSIALLAAALGLAWNAFSQPRPAPEPEKPSTVKAEIPKPPPLHIARIALPPPPVPKPTVIPELPPPPMPVKIKPLAPKPVPAQKQATTSAPDAPQHTVAIDGRAQGKTGRALLRLLEHGKGPAIEIAWPENAAAREALHRYLESCLGMQVAVMDGRKQLFRRTEPAGTPWALDGDVYSGFLRAPEGAVTQTARKEVRDIVARHRIIDGHPVRVFPRAVDARLLGGLAALIGPGYDAARRITAAYRLDAGGLTLTTIRVDGEARPGSIRLAGAVCEGPRAGS